MIIRGFNSGLETAYYYAFTCNGVIFFFLFSVMSISSLSKASRFNIVCSLSFIFLALGNLFAWIKLCQPNEQVPIVMVLDGKL